MSKQSKHIALVLFFLCFTFTLHAGNEDSKKYGGSLVISAPHFVQCSQDEITVRRIIMKTIMQNIGSMRRMYEERINKHEPFEQKVSVKITLNNKGKVLECSLDSVIINDSIFVDNCITLIRDMKFDRISNEDDTTIILYPFEFKYKEN